jgi:hypothetical protein
MAILVGANANTRAAKDPSGGEDSAPAFGVSATINMVTGSTSVNIPLPVDANGRLYPAYQFTADANSWLAFCTTSGDAATIGGANNYLINGTGVATLAATPQAVLSGGLGAFVAGISATAASHICVTGIF